MMRQDYPEHVRIVEVGPRDGLQNESADFSTRDRFELTRRLLDCGFERVEAGAFVSPKWVPKMADTAELLAQLSDDDMERVAVLVPNGRGMESAIEAGVREIAIFGAASEAFSAKNINCSIAESLKRFEPVCQSARDHGIRIRGYISCVLGCPYQGDVDTDTVADITQQLLDMGCYEVSLGDTIGVGTPRGVERLLERLLESTPAEKLAVHFHDTYGQAVANIYAALRYGIATVDSSVAGLGGCPYAPGAAGNVATEDVLYLLNGLEIGHGVNFDGVVEAGAIIMERLGKPPASRVSAAMLGKRARGS